MVVVVTPSMVKETSLTTVLADEEEPLPPVALLLDEDEEDEVDDVAPVCDVEEVDCVDAVEVSGDAMFCDVAEEIVMVMLA
jgi:hypothetical protein